MSALTVSLSCCILVVFLHSQRLNDDPESHAFEHTSLHRVHSSAPPGSGWTARWAFLKEHTPSIISLLSVVLNIVVLSVLLPNLRSDVRFMQGQTSELNLMVTNMQQSVSTVLAQVNLQVDAVTMRMNAFNAELDGSEARFNATELRITTTLDHANGILDLLTNGTIAAVTLFAQAQTHFEQQSNASILEVRSETAQLEQRVSTAQGQLNGTLQLLQTETASSMSQIVAANSSAVQVALSFERDVIPAFEMQMRSLNVTRRLNALELSGSYRYFVPNEGMSTTRGSWISNPSLSDYVIPQAGTYAIWATARMGGLDQTYDQTSVTRGG